MWLRSLPDFYMDLKELGTCRRLTVVNGFRLSPRAHSAKVSDEQFQSHSRIQRLDVDIFSTRGSKPL